MRFLRWICGGAAAMAATSAMSQFGVNIDLDGYIGTPETGNGVPSDNYGAAAGQLGRWNRVLANGTGSQPWILNALSGAPSAATLLTTGGVGSAGGYNNPAFSGDFRLLMADYMDIGPQVQFRFNGFEPGHYWLYTYGGDASGLAIAMFVSVPGSSTPTQTISGPVPPMQFAPGLDYCVHDLLLTGSFFEIDLSSNGPPSGQVHGFQIVPVPEPATCALLLVGLAATSVKRRSM